MQIFLKRTLIAFSYYFCSEKRKEYNQRNILKLKMKKLYDTPIVVKLQPFLETYFIKTAKDRFSSLGATRHSYNLRLTLAPSINGTYNK